jgi:5-formyltetrahydrofolate cyclo-ligase
MSARPHEEGSQGILTKGEWRRAIVAAIARLDPHDRSAQEASLAVALPGLPGWSGAGTVLLYISAFPEEIRTAPLLAMAYASGKRVILPRVDRRARKLRLYRVIDPGRELGPGALGIPEPHASLPEVPPEAVDWALVPGLAFDDRGYRLGRGAGHYDRLLPAMRTDAVCWAFGLGCQLVPRLPVEPHDVAMDGVTTAERTVLGVGRPDAPRSSVDRGGAG